MAEETLYTERTIRTVTGLYINVFEPTEEMICIEDIAHGLSMQCRWGGHTKKFYSVAEHSFCVSINAIKELQLAALLHDASEAYLLDIPKPIKRELTQYVEIEENLMRVIAKKFGFQWPLHPEIKKYDKAELEREWLGIKLNEKPENFWFWNPEKAKEMFLYAYEQYTK